MRPIQKSKKLDNVYYDIRGPVLEKARQIEEESYKIIKLNIGNLAVFGFEPLDLSVVDGCCQPFRRDATPLHM